MTSRGKEYINRQNGWCELLRHTLTALAVNLVLGLLIIVALEVEIIRADEHNLYDEKLLHGLDYSPFRDGDNPNWGIFPTLDEIQEDLFIMSGLTSRIRTYGNDGILYEIPRLCNEEQMEIYAGAWIYWDRVVNDQNISRLIQIAEKGYNTTIGLIVGNEVLLRGDISDAELLDYLKTVKDATGLPVSTAETYWNYLNYSGIANEVDFIFIHIHPYWDGISIEAAAQYVLDKYTEVKEAHPDKEVVIGETGWPTAGDTVGEAVPSEENQDRFLEEFTQMAAENNVKYFIFSAFDEKWKVQDEGTVGASWGLYYSNRRPKPSIDDYVSALNEYIEDDNNARTDASGSEEGGGCFIATAGYGDISFPFYNIERLKEQYQLKNK